VARRPALISYRVRLADLDRHLFEIECRVDDPAPEQRFSLPAWIPGSYLLREFARFVVGIEASSAGQSLPVEKVESSAWVVRVATDLKLICETQIEFFGRPAPFDRYWFLCLAVGGDAWGGLEHRASTSLIFSRDDLPKAGDSGVPREYQRFLALASHEYFHTWHVKRTKPVAFIPYRLDRRVHTRLLWVFEGLTSYYQELMLLRSGVIGVPAFLQRLAEALTRVYRTPGRLRQSLADSSFDAWDVLYKPEANHPNSSISYYTKGALV